MASIRVRKGDTGKQMALFFGGGVTSLHENAVNKKKTVFD